MKNILWDLDGTLTDPKTGIVRCIQYALKELGKRIPDESELLWCIGPPLHQAFQELAPESSRSEVLALVAKYRERYAEIGLYENDVYPGIQSLLLSLKGRKHFLATSKPHVFASVILDHFKLTSSFSNVYGSEMDGTRSDKAELIDFVLKSENLEPADTFMIGDRRYDVLGAKKMGLKSIGVTWGYGGSQELDEAGADYIFDDIGELGAFLALAGC